ncbi:MAG: sensor histidine kinase, partial [Chitinophagaceae bacterium]|nr:sensor histidine kinase [Chitinophagaceae bacterium]
MKEHYFNEFSEKFKKDSDRLMNYFLIGFFLCGFLLAFYYDTWLIAFGVGGLSLTAYYSAKFILPDSNLYQYVLSTIIGIFMAQYIYQTHGMFEMHFLAFIGSAILITYRNWKLQIPLAFVVIVHHAVFGYLQFIGFDKIYFTQLEYMSLETFIIHGFLATAVFFLCGLWAHNFKKSDELQTAQAVEIEKIFNRVEEVLFSFDETNLRFLKISVACENVFGYTPAEFMADGSLWIKIIHTNDKHFINENYDILRSGKTAMNQHRIIHRDGSIRWLEVKLIPTLDKQGSLVRIDGICKDVTEKIKLEKKLAEERKQQQQQITAAVITAQENERSFLGQELHDNINPTLATAMLFIDSAMSDNDKRIHLMKESKGFINTALNEIRDLSKSLVPQPVKAIGLKDTIRDLLDNIKQVNNYRVITTFENLDESVLSDKLRLTIFRILQEQVNNIMKHARAQTISIRLKQRGTELQLMIKDDGIGFDISKKREGVGLQNIISRTELFNGNVLINSRPGKG